MFVGQSYCYVFLTIPLLPAPSLPFLSLNLRNSGLNPSKIPRPREGSRALDAVMLPLLDIEVRRKKRNNRKEDE